MELADFFAIDRLSQHDEELLIESAMQMQQMMMMLYESGIREIKTKLDILSDESRISGKPSPIDAIKSRIKVRAALSASSSGAGFPITLQSMIDNLNDIGGIRVICPFIEDILHGSGHAHAAGRLDADREEKDYIANPKPNGYRSLHLILEVPIFLAERTQPVRIEVQIRTIAMDFWASLGTSCAINPMEIPEHMSDDLKKCADVIAETDQEMQRIAKKN